MQHTSLSDLRDSIDSIDAQIVGLLNKRADLVVQVGKIKSSTNTEAYDPVREHLVLDKVDRLNHGPLPKGSIEEIYAAIMTACREIQIKKATQA